MHALVAGFSDVPRAQHAEHQCCNQNNIGPDAQFPPVCQVVIEIITGQLDFGTRKHRNNFTLPDKTQIDILKEQS